MSRQTIIIGAGVVGVTIAWELARRGVQVSVVDAADGPGGACSHANAGLIAPGHVDALATPATLIEGLSSLHRRTGPFRLSPHPAVLPYALRMARSSTPARAQRHGDLLRELAVESLHRHVELPRLGVQTGIRRAGSLDVLSSKARAAAARAEAARPGDQRRDVTLAGHDTHAGQLLNAEQVAALEPALAPVPGAIRHSQDAHVDSREYLAGMVRACAELGVPVRWGVRVRRLERCSGARLELVAPGVRMEADHVVIAAGLESARIGASLGLRLPLISGKGYVVDLADSGVELGRPVTFMEDRVVATPYDDVLRLCGTFELGGVPDTIDARRVEGILAVGRRRLPGLRTDNVVQMWAGQRPCSADGMPLIGRSRVHPGVAVAAGHGMWGLTLAPATARLVADDLCEQRGVPAPLSADRFTATR
ncbi:NAD(P)/FAD-dependent oxidoreductase [Gephyromycinifex aptenodytis]|uniref:NAD(P)/FAD-dependent oxidoreductase n=1 Tax=Gephyromycinifex aptenodytis TaxID=2716227 RepID=UPI001445BD3B|nr:FAD-dependent oxidoreductase [Gephyromycinifex aptenodytis]